MIDLKQAAQQALEALETCGEDEWHSEDDFGMVQTYDEDKVAKAIIALRTALEQQAKPVAWMYTSRFAGNQQYITRFQHDLTTYKADKVWPLYTTPAQAADG